MKVVGGDSASIYENQRRGPARAGRHGMEGDGVKQKSPRGVQRRSGQGKAGKETSVGEG